MWQLRGKRASMCPRARLALALLSCGLLALAGCGGPGEAAGRPIVLYPPLPQRPRIQFLCELNSSEDVRASQNSFRQFILGEDVKRPVFVMTRPHGMLFHEDKLYVCDSRAKIGVIFDFKRRDLRLFPDPKAYRLGMPGNISAGAAGEKYLADSARGEVIVFDQQDRPLRSITRQEGMKPVDVVWHEGKLYVADMRSNSVLVFEPKTGRFERQIGKEGETPGAFKWPVKVAFGPQGHLYVCDLLNARVQELDGKGKVVRVYGGLGDYVGKMVRPRGIAVDREARLYVVDSAPEHVQMFDSEGHVLLLFGGSGPGPGDMSLPCGVAISYEGVEHFAQYAAPDFQIEHLIFVSNQFGPKKVNVYGFGKYLGAVPAERGQEGGNQEQKERDGPPPEKSRQDPAGAARKAGEEK